MPPTSVIGLITLGLSIVTTAVVVGMWLGSRNKGLEIAAHDLSYKADESRVDALEKRVDIVEQVVKEQAKETRAQIKEGFEELRRELLLDRDANRKEHRASDQTISTLAQSVGRLEERVGGLTDRMLAIEQTGALNRRSTDTKRT